MIVYHLRMADDAYSGQLLMTADNGTTLRLAVNRHSGPALQDLRKGEYAVMATRGWRRMTAQEADAISQAEAKGHIEWNKFYVASLRKLGFFLTTDSRAGPEAPRCAHVNDGYRYVSPSYIARIAYVRK